MCDGQRTTLGVIHSSGMSTLFFEIGFLPGLELVKYAGLASQQVSAICLSPPTTAGTTEITTHNTHHAWLFISMFESM